MTPEWKAAKRIFARVIRLQPAKRAAFLQKCPNEAVRHEVESLLAHHDRTERRLGIPGSIGDQLLSHYRILEQVGGGGMGLVYKARDEHLNRSVAIKVLLPWAMGDPASRARLLEEARCAGALNHPHIVTIYELAREKEIDFIVMEYVDGKTLDRHILPRGLPLTKAMTWALEIGSALEAAHGIGILHRDLKPSNVIVTSDGRTKLLDFGLASRPGGPEAKPDFGTRAYMAPEQLAGNATPDVRAEVFSFGLILHHMLTGKVIAANAPVSAKASASPDIPPSPHVKRHVAVTHIVRQCLATDPRERFQSMTDVLCSLKNASAHTGHPDIEDEQSNNTRRNALEREMRAEVRKINYASLAESRRAVTRIIQLLKATTPGIASRILVPAMKVLLLSPPDSNGVVSMPIREVRKLALDLLREATGGDLRCFQPGDLEQLDLYGMDFTRLSLNGQSFQGSFLVEADFQDSVLRDASLAGASVRNANFAGADLTGCDFTDVDWFHATGLSDEQLGQAKKNTLRACPATIQEMHRHLSARYAFPFTSWSDHVQEQIVAAWAIYLQPGGLREVVARWRASHS